MTAGAAPMGWIPLLNFPIEWAALSLFVAACLFWERAGLSGLAVEGCAAAAMIGLILGYEGTEEYELAVLAAAGAAVAFALVAAGLVRALRADPAVGFFCLSLVPICGLGLLTRTGPYLIFVERPLPGLLRGTRFDGTYAEDLVSNPLLLAAPILVALAGWILWRTPFGLRLRAFGENPRLRLPRMSAGAHRVAGAALGAALAVPGAALLVRAYPENPPSMLGFLALACAVAGRWSLAAGVLLAAGPALLRTARPYMTALGGWAPAAEMAPFLLVILYLALLSRRALRLESTRQSRLDPDVL